jgi:hypothetical protein
MYWCVDPSKYTFKLDEIDQKEAKRVWFNATFQLTCQGTDINHLQLTVSSDLLKRNNSAFEDLPLPDEKTAEDRVSLRPVCISLADVHLDFTFRELFSNETGLRGSFERFYRNIEDRELRKWILMFDPL